MTKILVLCSRDTQKDSSGCQTLSELSSDDSSCYVYKAFIKKKKVSWHHYRSSVSNLQLTVSSCTKYSKHCNEVFWYANFGEENVQLNLNGLSYTVSTLAHKRLQDGLKHSFQLHRNSLLLHSSSLPVALINYFAKTRKISLSK